MGKSKRGKNVWQCMACGYWTERGGNIDRHNSRAHGGVAPIRQVFATLVIEASYHVPPIQGSSVPASAAAYSPPGSLVAFDTPLGTEQSSISSRSRNSLTTRKESSDPMDDLDSRLEKVIRLKEKMQKLGLVWPGNSVGGSSAFSPPPAAGFVGNVCERCGEPNATQIPVDKDPAEYASTLESHYSHVCGKDLPKFESEQAREEHIRQGKVKAASFLLQLERTQLGGRNILLVAKKLDRMPQSPIRRSFKHRMTQGDLISKAIEAGTLGISEAELYKFLLEAQATAGIFEVIEAQVEKEGEEAKEGRDGLYYSIAVQGQRTIEDEITALFEKNYNIMLTELMRGMAEGIAKTSLATSTVFSSSSSIVANNNNSSNNIRAEVGLVANQSSSSGTVASNNSIDTQSSENSNARSVPGWKGWVCEICLKPQVVPLSTFLANPQLAKETHLCTGKEGFAYSEEAEQNRKKKSEENMVYLLLNATFDTLQGNEVLLASQKISQEEEQHFRQIIEASVITVDEKDSEHYISKVIREGSIRPRSNQLLDFLLRSKATCGLYEIRGSGEKHFVSIVWPDSKASATQTIQKRTDNASQKDTQGKMDNTTIAVTRADTSTADTAKEDQ